MTHDASLPTYYLGVPLFDGANVSDAPSAFPEGALARRAVIISRGSAGLHSPKGDGPKAAYGTLVGICRLRRGCLFPEGRMLVAVGAVPPGRGARGRLEMVL